MTKRVRRTHRAAKPQKRAGIGQNGRMADFVDEPLPLMPSPAAPAPVSRRQAAEAIAAHFEALERCAAAVSEAGERLAEEVASARAAGFSWQDVGEALGIDRETARRRYGAA